MTDLAARLLTHIRDAGLFPEPGVALLAVSGGPDSVALLSLMHAVAPDTGLHLAVAHVDHGIAVDSAETARGVAELAAAFGMPFRLRCLNLGPDASETKARDGRYQGLRDIQREANARYLVTAHQHDDQIETVLYRFLRGSGIAGLAGIPATGPDGLVRPLLPFSRQELEEWLAAHRTPDAGRLPVHDPANEDARHDRSWLRIEIMPRLINRFGDDLARHLDAVAHHAQQERAAWTAMLRSVAELEFSLVGGVVEVAQATVARYDKTLSEALLRALAREVGGVLSHDHAKELARFVRNAKSGQRMPLGGGLEAELAFGRLRLIAATGRTTHAVAVTFPESPDGSLEWNGWQLTWCRESAGTVERTAQTTWLTPGSVTVRSVAAGDRLEPLGGVGRRKVRRLLMEAKVPSGERDRYPVVARGDDVVWVPGVCRGALHVPQLGETALRLDATPPDGNKHDAVGTEEIDA